MIAPEVLDALVASGCTPEQIAAAVKASMASEAAALEVKRAKDRARKRAARAADKEDVSAIVHSCPVESDVVRGNPRTYAESTDIAGTVSLSPVPLLSPTPPNNPLTPIPIHKPNSRGTRLPENWVLSGPNLAYALSKGFPEQRIGAMAEKFSNWAWSASGPNAVKRNWDRAWQNWVLSELERSGPGPRAGPAKPLTAFQQSRQETKDILDDLENFARGGGSSSQEDPQLLLGHSGGRSEELRGGTGPNVIDLPAVRRDTRM